MAGDGQGALGLFGEDEPSVTARRSSTPDMDTVIQVAARLFYEKGYQNTTMEALAGELGITKPTLYAHARSKGFLLRQIFQRVLRQADGLIDEALAKPDPADGIASLIDGQIRLSVMYRDYYGVIYGDARELPADMDKAYRKWAAAFVTKVRDVVERGQQSGAIRRDIAPIVAAQSIIGITGWSARWLRPQLGIPLDDARRQLTAVILRGLAPERSEDQCGAAGPPKPHL